MGMSTLNVWITAPGDPCAIDSRTWLVYLFDCHLRPVRWCDRRYQEMPAKCGHLEVEVPPGCYVVIARLERHFSHAAVVEACCEKRVCVKLFVPRSPEAAAEFAHLLEPEPARPGKKSRGG